MREDTLEFIDENMEEGDKVRITIDGVIKGVDRRPDYSTEMPMAVGEKTKKEPPEKRFVKVAYSKADLTAKRIGTEAQNGANKIMSKLGAAKEDLQEEGE